VPITRAARVLHVVAGRKFFSFPGCCGTRFAQTVLAKDAGKTEKLKRSLKGHNMKHPGNPTLRCYNWENKLKLILEFE